VARLLRYMLRALLALLLLLDLKLFITLFFPMEDRQVATAMEWSLIVLAIGLLLSLQAFIVWLDIRIGRKKRSGLPAPPHIESNVHDRLQRG
jgi:hypothetical protein